MRGRARPPRAARRSAALKAAVCFARAGRMSDAATIVLALGARESVVGTLLEVDDQLAAESCGGWHTWQHGLFHGW